MRKDTWTFISAVTIATLSSGCASQEIPQMYRGRMYERTSVAVASGDKAGFTGPVLGPGSYDVSASGEIHKVECSTMTARDTLGSLTKDGVPIGLNVYVRFHADCTDDGVEQLLDALSVDDNNSVTAVRVFQVYVRPEIGAVLRAVFAPVLARDLFVNRDALLEDARARILKMIAEPGHHIVAEGVYFSDVTIPPELQKANIELAAQAAQRDKATAERAPIDAVSGNAEMRQQGRAGARWVPDPQDPAAKRADPDADRPATNSEASDAAKPDENPYY